MKNAFIIFLFILINSIYAQSLQWSQPILMCDSIANNISPSFIHSWDNMVDYNFMVWERDYGDSSKILGKHFLFPDSEFVLLSSLPNCKVSYPKVSFSSIVVWQDDQNNNIDLYAAIVQNNQLSNIQQITTSILDDINPDLFENILVWQRNGNILISEFNFNDSTWSQEILIDSSSCSNPKIGQMQITYQKQNGDSSEIYLIENQGNVWGNPVKISHRGDNINPIFSFGIFYNLLWQQKVYSDWNIFAASSYWFPDTVSFNFSHFNETNPAGFGIPLITKGSDLEYMFLAFETDSTGDKEIFVNDNMWVMIPQNLSNNMTEDRLPVYSSGGWNETGYNMVRVWLVWQSRRNNHWQLWGSFNDVMVASIENEDIGTPNQFELYQNFPNPFNSQTSIKYYLPKAGNVKIEIFNLLGQRIKTLTNQNQKNGEHHVIWNGRDENNLAVASGVYVYRLTTDKYLTSKKLLFLK